MKIKINNNKNIGKVIYVVEGVKDEPTLITYIFNKLFNYSVIKYNKNNNTITKLINENNKYSKVYIIPAKYSAISTLDLNDEYFDNVFEELSKYELDIDNSALYFIFDRDRQSNRPAAIKKQIEKYFNSRDNGIYRNGLFLLSYPSIEAFYLNCNNDNNRFSSGKDIKEYISDITKDLNYENIISGTSIILKKINDVINDSFIINMLDNFKDINASIFNYEENIYNKDKLYDTLSLLFLSLLDLGLIEIEQ